MKSRRILLFIDTLLSGGAQRQMVVLANELHRRGHEVELLTYYADDQLSHFLRSPAIRRETLHRRGRFDLGFPFRLILHFHRSAPDCIISYLTAPNFWARTAGRLAGVRRIVTSERNVPEHIEATPWVYVERLLEPLSTRVVVNSNEIRHRLVRLGIGRRGIDVIYNGVDVSHFTRCTDAQRAATRERLGIAPGDFLILLPGRIQKQKNHLLLVQALQGLGSTYMHAKVAFAGNEFDQGLKRQIVDEIRGCGLAERFQFLGPRSDMPDLYSAADVVVLPSLWEGFPNSVVEAMACETPVIVSDVSDNRTIVESGVSGFVFASGDRTGLVKALEVMMQATEGERRTMGRRASQRVQELCSLETFGDRYEALIESCFQS